MIFNATNYVSSKLSTKGFPGMTVDTTYYASDDGYDGWSAVNLSEWGSVGIPAGISLGSVSLGNGTSSSAGGYLAQLIIGNYASVDVINVKGNSSVDTLFNDSGTITEYKTDDGHITNLYGCGVDSNVTYMFDGSFYVTWLGKNSSTRYTTNLYIPNLAGYQGTSYGVVTIGASAQESGIVVSRQHDADSSAHGYYQIFINRNIYTVSNSSTISGAFQNSGSIYSIANNSTGTISSLYNSGTMSYVNNSTGGTINSLANYADIINLNNSASIQGFTNASPGCVDNIVNDGEIDDLQNNSTGDGIALAKNFGLIEELRNINNAQITTIYNGYTDGSTTGTPVIESIINGNGDNIRFGQIGTISNTIHSNIALIENKCATISAITNSSVGTSVAGNIDSITNGIGYTGTTNVAVITKLTNKYEGYIGAIENSGYISSINNNIRDTNSRSTINVIDNGNPASSSTGTTFAGAINTLNNYYGSNIATLNTISGSTITQLNNAGTVGSFSNTGKLGYTEFSINSSSAYIGSSTYPIKHSGYIYLNGGYNTTSTGNLYTGKVYHKGYYGGASAYSSNNALMYGGYNSGTNILGQGTSTTNFSSTSATAYLNIKASTASALYYSYISPGASSTTPSWTQLTSTSVTNVGTPTISTMYGTTTRPTVLFIRNITSSSVLTYVYAYTSVSASGIIYSSFSVPAHGTCMVVFTARPYSSYYRVAATISELRCNIF